MTNRITRTKSSVFLSFIDAETPLAKLRIRSLDRMTGVLLWRECLRPMVRLRWNPSRTAELYRADQLAVFVRAQGQPCRIWRGPKARDRARLAMAARERHLCEAHARWR
jgi:hypothetical protein